MAAHAEPDAAEVPKKLRTLVAKQLGCASGSMKFEHIQSVRVFKWDHASWTLLGCGEQTMITYVQVGHSGFVRDDRQVRLAAPLDLRCEPSQLTYTYVNESARSVQGCGRRATYAATPAGWVATLVAE